MFLHSTARFKDGRLSRADSRKAAKDLNRRKQREFEQKLAKLAKVRHLPSEKLFFRHGHSPALTHRAIARRRLPQKTAISRELRCAQISLDAPTAGVLTPLPGTAFPQEPPLLPLLPSVQSLLFASFCEWACLVVAASPPCALR